MNSMRSKAKKKMAMLVCIMLILAAFAPISALAAPVWTEIGGGVVSTGSAGNVRIAVSDGDVYCAYLDGAPTWKPTVKKADGSSWTGGLVADCMSYSIDIEVNPSNGRIYAAYTDQTANKTYVREYIEGTGWQQVGGEVYSSGGMMLDLEFIGNVPYVAYNWISVVTRECKRPSSAHICCRPDLNPVSSIQFKYIRIIV